MLIRVGRWLRAAGYDTQIAQACQSDCELYALAYKEQRLLITRDRHFLKYKGEASVIWLQSNLVRDCIRELSEKVTIDWLRAPFSRCLLCNTLLVETVPADVSALAPLQFRSSERIYKCPTCQKIYWTGSHTARMLANLSRWNVHQF